MSPACIICFAVLAEISPSWELSSDAPADELISSKSDDGLGDVAERLREMGTKDLVAAS